MFRSVTSSLVEKSPVWAFPARPLRDWLTLVGQPVRIYGLAKTLADLFKLRNKVGIDTALEAIREAWKNQRFTMDELDHYARICRVQRVMRPYLEAMIA